MKKFLLLVLTIIPFIACSSDDDSGIMQDLAPTLSANLPESFVFGHLYDIEITYERPSSCHSFLGLDVSPNENEITIGVVTAFNTNSRNCMSSGNLQATATIKFVAERDDFYIFRFWQGKNQAGEDEFLTVEVPVMQPGIE